MDNLKTLNTIEETIDRLVKTVDNPNEFMEDLFRWSQKIMAVGRTVADMGDVPANMSTVAAEWLDFSKRIASAYPLAKAAEGVEVDKREMTIEDFLRYAVAELAEAAKSDKKSDLLKRLAALKFELGKARTAFTDATEKFEVAARKDVVGDKDAEVVTLFKSMSDLRIDALADHTQWPTDLNQPDTSVDFGSDPA